MGSLETLRRAALAVAVTTVIAGAANAAPITTPDGFVPGDQYRLAFVTSGTRDAASADIADYNAFVSGLADAVAELAALGTEWRAIGSTATVSALDNTETDPGNAGHASLPIYLLDGTTLLAANNADLWDGSIGSALNIDETGTALAASERVWSGSSFTGLGLAGRELGAGLTVVGSSTGTSIDWIFAAIDASTVTYRLYALSDVITVAAEEPPADDVPPAAQVDEPGTILLLGAGLVGIAAARRRRRG